MKYDKAGEYEVTVSATDDCDNETTEVRNVLVAKEIIAGDNITLSQDGNTVTVSADVCGALNDCPVIEQINSDIARKQDTLTAGENITIENGVISAQGGDLSNYYTKNETDELLDDKQDTLIAGNNITIENGVISADDVDLSDYYTKSEVYNKSETYNKEEVDNLIDAIQEFSAMVVEELPQTGEERTIYLVPKQGGGYTEHLYVNGAWEEIGDTDIDLSNYYTKSETNNFLDDKVDKVAGKGLSTNDYTNEDKAIVDSVPVTYATKDEISAFLSCDTLGNCQTISDMQNAIDGKQDVLTAGSHITIAQDGTISATGMTKAEILAELGYAEIPMSIKDTNNVETKVMVLGRVVE